MILTLMSAWASGPWQHGLVRFLVGWASGWAMVLIAAWSNEQLHRYQRPGLSAAVFAGPGTGIFISGMLAVGLHSHQVSAAWAWLAYGVLALVLVVLIARTLPRTGQLHRPETAPEPLRLTPASGGWCGATAWPGLAISCPRRSWRKWRPRAFPG